MGSSSAEGTGLELQECNDSDTQVWAVRDGQFVNRAAERCLTIAGGQSTQRSVSIAACTGSDGQRWVLDAEGRVVNSASGLCLSVREAKTTSGASLNAWLCREGRPNQTWSRAA